jgi:hypothetical protein
MLENATNPWPNCGEIDNEFKGSQPTTMVPYIIQEILEVMQIQEQLQ